MEKPMIRMNAFLLLAAAGLAAPAQACSTRGSSTFCADGWVAQSHARTGDQGPTAEQDNAWLEDGAGTDPALPADGIYVEGAYAVDSPASGDDGEL